MNVVGIARAEYLIVLIRFRLFGGGHEMAEVMAQISFSTWRCLIEAEGDAVLV